MIMATSMHSFKGGYFVEEELQHCATMSRQSISSELRNHNSKTQSFLEMEQEMPILVSDRHHHLNPE